MGRQLAKAGYDVTVLLDDQAAPGPVFRALQTRPTVIYFATHRGEDKEHHNNAIAVAGFIGAAAEKNVSVGGLTPRRGGQAVARLAGEIPAWHSRAPHEPSRVITRPIWKKTIGGERSSCVFARAETFIELD